MVLTVFLIAIGVGAALLTMTHPISVSLSNKQAKDTEAVLAQAKEALLGRSASDASRPGSLPCPDAITNIVGTNVPNDGIADLFAGNDCPSYIGRLPWRTLGLPDLRDASGERLWYMLSTRFRDHPTAEPINTDTKGNVTVYLGSTSTTLTSEAVAAIFAPGAAIGNQIRDAAGQNNPANYLESGAGWNNASGAGPYLIAQLSATVNDRLLVISTADLLTPVEYRAAQEILSLLKAYKAASSCNCYPWADFSDGVSSPSTDNDREGRLPLLGAVPEAWGSGGRPAVPTWLINNMWWWPFLYTIAPIDTEYHNSGTLTLDGVSGKRVVLITTGPAGAGRPAGAPLTWDDAWWSFYVDDSQNSDLGSVFVTPSSSAYARDRIYTIP